MDGYNRSRECSLSGCFALMLLSEERFGTPLPRKQPWPCEVDRATWWEVRSNTNSVIFIVLCRDWRGCRAPLPSPLSRTTGAGPRPGEHKGERTVLPRRPAARSCPRAAQRPDRSLARGARAVQAATPTRARSRLRCRPDEYASPRSRPRLLLSVSFPPPGGSEEPRFPRAGAAGAGRGRAGGERETERAGAAAVPGPPRSRRGQSEGGEGASARPYGRAG